MEQDQSLAIEVHGLAKRFGSTVAVDGLDLSVRAGSIYGLLGPNGAGKTTTVRLLATLLRPDAGRVTVLGHDVVRAPQEVRRRIALTTERGTGFLLDLPDVPDLLDGDALRLTSGEMIAVSAAPEALMEIRCRDALHLARMAWHIGNRHTPCQIAADHLTIRRDHVIEAMLIHIGANLTRTTGPFRPEGGAYGKGRTMGHDHGHSHHHD